MIECHPIIAKRRRRDPAVTYLCAARCDIPRKQHFKVHIHNGTTVYETTDNREAWARRNAQHIDKLNTGFGAPHTHVAYPAVLNRHVLLAMRWLGDTHSVTHVQLKDNAAEARQACHNGRRSFRTSYRAHRIAFAASCYAYATTSICIDEYFEITGEDRQRYVEALCK